MARDPRRRARCRHVAAVEAVPEDEQVIEDPALGAALVVAAEAAKRRVAGAEEDVDAVDAVEAVVEVDEAAEVAPFRDGCVIRSGASKPSNMLPSRPQRATCSLLVPSPRDSRLLQTAHTHFLSRGEINRVASRLASRRIATPGRARRCGLSFVSRRPFRG